MLSNTCIEYKFADGDSVQLTLAFYSLYQLKGRDKKMYEDVNRIMTKGATDIFDNIKLIYTAYLCANISNLDSCMSYEEFMIKCGSDYQGLKEATEKLIKPKN